MFRVASFLRMREYFFVLEATGVSRRELANRRRGIPIHFRNLPWLAKKKTWADEWKEKEGVQA